MALKWKKDEDGNHVSHDGNFRVSKTNYHPNYGFAHDSGEKATFWMLSKKDTKLGSAPDYFVNHRSHMSLSKAKASATDWHKKMNEGKLAPVWAGKTDQLQNIVWKKKEIGRKAKGILHKKGKSSVEKVRPVGEDSTPQAGLGAGAMVSVEPSIMDPKDPVLGKKKTLKGMNKTPKGVVESGPFADRKFEVDNNDPISQAGKKGDWLKTHGSIEPHHIVSVEKYMPKKLGESWSVEKAKAPKSFGEVGMTNYSVVKHKGKKVGDIHKDEDGWNALHHKSDRSWSGVDSKVKAVTLVRKYHEKHGNDAPAKKKPSQVERLKASLAETKDQIGKQTPSVEQIAKKHGLSVDQINAQIEKGIKVEVEHTKSKSQAHEIARDHLDEFPDYYDRLDKMEKKAKKDMRESVKNSFRRLQNPPQLPGPKGGFPVPAGKERVRDGYGMNTIREPLKKPVNEANYHSRVVSHPAVADVDHGGPGDYFVNLKKGWHLGDGSRSFGNESPRDAWKMLKHATQKDYKKWVTEDAVPNSVGGGMSPVIGGEGNIHGIDPIMGKPIRRKKHTDSEASKQGGWGAKKTVNELTSKTISSYYARRDNEQANKPRKSPKKLQMLKLALDKLHMKSKVYAEDAVPNSVGGGMSPTIGGEGNIHGIDPIMGQKPIRRRKFAGKQVFVVDPNTYHKAYLGKRKYEHYEKYLEGSPMADEIREYGRKNWAEPIIIENEQTGAMVYLKYGSK